MESFGNTKYNFPNIKETLYLSTTIQPLKAKELKSHKYVIVLSAEHPFYYKNDKLPHFAQTFQL